MAENTPREQGIRPALERFGAVTLYSCCEDQAPFATLAYGLAHPLGWQDMINCLCAVADAGSVHRVEVGQTPGANRDLTDAMEARGLRGALESLPEGSWIRIEGTSPVIDRTFRLQLSNQTCSATLQVLGLPDDPHDFDLFIGGMQAAVFGTAFSTPTMNLRQGMRDLLTCVQRMEAQDAGE